MLLPLMKYLKRIKLMNTITEKKKGVLERDEETIELITTTLDDKKLNNSEKIGKIMALVDSNVEVNLKQVNLSPFIQDSIQDKENI